MVDPALRSALDELPASVRGVAAYHFGWCDEQLRPTGQRSGKAVRPLLTLLSAAALGGPAAAALPAATAVELVHNFSLLHDDVMDGDERRRHRPTAWRVFGTGPALLAGNALLTQAAVVLGDGASAVDQQRMLADTVLQLLDGQAADLDFEHRLSVSPDEYLTMAEKKTGALLGCSCGLGAVGVGADPITVGRLVRFGRLLGLIFQIVDDLLGIWGDPAVTGKPVHSDLRRRKKSLPVVLALGSRFTGADELADLYHGDRPLSDAELARAAYLIDESGAREWSRLRADVLRGQAEAQLTSAAVSGPGAAGLRTLADHLTRRTR
ncbi:polyprenyl synthetase family protein [Skermania piniformis]|uniref:Polyprenyl synthetase family protein n=1 Tax=Skermania pinensis TaxID=39122 RepID=A0ABX8SH24_9ACTN|nr:polyprenyl synthetase family protein [Skermania piniformis]